LLPGASTITPSRHNRSRQSIDRFAKEAAPLAILLDGIDLNAKRLARWSPPEGIDTVPRS